MIKIFVRNRDIFRKKQSIEFYKKWRNVAPDNSEFQEEVEVGLILMEIELKMLKEKNKKWNKMFE